MGEKLPFRARDADATQAGILRAARAEFARAGLAGARVDTIAEQSGANKRMIYHYFGGKEQLFAAVLADAYLDIREAEQQLGLDGLPPAQALRRLVEFTWQYYLDKPEFITLVNSANLHEARHIDGNGELPRRQQAYVRTVADILARGEKAGVFRSGIDAVQLCITIPAIAFYYLNNRHTGRVLFGFDFLTPQALDARLQFNVDTILRLVLRNPDAA